MLISKSAMQIKMTVMKKNDRLNEVAVFKMKLF